MANDYVTFKAADLAVTAGTPLTGGTNGTVDGTAHQAYLDKIESYTYNTMGVVVTDDVTKKLYVAFNKRLMNLVSSSSWLFTTCLLIIWALSV